METARIPEPSPDLKVTVDPGQVIKVDARFRGEPKRVLFSHLAPGATEAVFDPGFGCEGSKIQRLEDGRYRYVINTLGYVGGEGWWYFLGEYDDLAEQRAKLGQFLVRNAPRALFEREEAVEIFGANEVGVSSYVALAAIVDADLRAELLAS